MESQCPAPNLQTATLLERKNICVQWELLFFTDRICAKQYEIGLSKAKKTWHCDYKRKKCTMTQIILYVYLFSDESAAMLLPVGQFSQRIVDTAGKAGIV